MFFLADGDMADPHARWRALSDFDGRRVHRQVSHILWNPIEAEKGGYKHFMLKEIFEQPRAVRDTTLGRVGQETGRIFLDEMDITPAEFASFRQVKIIACGTSWHAALAGKFMIEKLARIPCEVDYGSEFRYRDPIVIPRHADHRHLAIRRDRRHPGGPARSEKQRVAHPRHLQCGRLHDHARGGRHHLHPRRSRDRRGFHQGVHLPVDRALHPCHVPGPGQRKPRTKSASRCLVQELRAPPRQARNRAFPRRPVRSARPQELHRATDFLFLGRGVHFPIALEGALKLKEISYIHAEGYPAGEMKHGPNALIDEKLPVVVLATHDPAARRAVSSTRRRSPTSRK